ncbi:MAG: hypothetical protein SFU57_03300 [Gemmatimonadales bacterium]|nr:hypothetical protein [Gemmatimonadales bacterium]
MRTRMLFPAALLTLALPWSLTGQTTDPCAGIPRCYSTSTFAATLTDFRESTVSYYRILSVTLRITNTQNRPLILGYVAGSALATDDQGNRYEMSQGSLRGLGEVRGNSFDSKFTLRPGESADARLELSFRPGNQIIGTQFALELALREIDPLPGNQFRLGREHSLQYRNLGELAPVAAEPVAAVVPTSDHLAGIPIDPCGDKQRCYATGPFMAEITSFTDSKAAYHHYLNFTVRFRNLSAEPVVLAYAAGSAVAQDDQGNRYQATANFPKGIGVSRSNRADPSFRLRPGESREATFQMIFRPGKAVLGTSYTVDFAVEQLEILPRNQIRTQQEFTLGFRDITIAGPGPAKAAKGLLDALRGRKP